MTETESRPAPEDLGERLDAARKRIVAADFDGALAVVDAILEEAPEATEALYTKAVAERYAGRTEAALATLERLKALAPDHGRAHQEEGHARLALGQRPAAIAAYRRAVRANPALEAAWKQQLELLLAEGRGGEAQAVKARLDHLLGLPKPLRAVMDLVSQGRLLKAEDLCRAFLEKVPHHVEAMRLLADIGLRLGVLDDAEFLLESAVAFAPDNAGARIDHIRALRKRQKFAAARAAAEALLESDPEDPQYRSIFAIECMQTGDFDRALATFDAILERMPDEPVTLTSRGHALKTAGRAGEAVDSYRRAVEAHPQHGEGWYALANLKTYRFEADELARMARLAEDTDLGHMDRVHIAFALGKAHEDAGDHAAAFTHYARGNALKKAQSRYDAEQMHEEMAAIRRTCTATLFEDRGGHGDPSPDPIFIVGLPRAGSTLLEQILSSHSLVDGTLELPDVLSLAQRLRRTRPDEDAPAPGYPEILERLPIERFAEFGARFLEDTRIHRAGAPFFTDKMPNNFRHIGLIRLMLPNARIIDARRHPMACCFSGFKQLFAEGQEFTYDLADIGHYYRDYVELMDHWDAVLPGAVLRVMHEDVVDDLEGQVRRVLDHCGLPFEDACLRYWETERNVRTPSSEQVRRPIFRESVEQWRHFEPWLDPLKEALGPVLERYPIDPA